MRVSGDIHRISLKSIGGRKFYNSEFTDNWKRLRMYES